MAEQNYQNHARYVPAFHFFLFGLILLTFIGSLVNLYQSMGDSTRLYSAALITVLSFCFIMLFFFSRIFPNKVQDRAIRAEENLRHYALTGKLLDSRLTMGQIIALRFAPDAEFVDLARKAASESLSSGAIKKSVKNWRADHNRGVNEVL
jgi:predicted PurR-regulated permease PerM